MSLSHLIRPSRCLGQLGAVLQDGGPLRYRAPLPQWNRSHRLRDRLPPKCLGTPPEDQSRRPGQLHRLAGGTDECPLPRRQIRRHQTGSTFLLLGNKIFIGLCEGNDRPAAEKSPLEGLCPSAGHHPPSGGRRHLCERPLQFGRQERGHGEGGGHSK